MEEIDKLLEVTDRLLGPEGCPWDREQTMKSIRPSILEEVCELIEAIDLEDNQHIQEELGDLLFNVLFLSRLAEKEDRFDLKGVANRITEKLISRHPHVFGENKIETAEAALSQWEYLKTQEADKSHRKSALDGISKSLPGLLRAKKMVRKMRKCHYKGLPASFYTQQFENEDELGKLLFAIICQAEKQGIDPESALKKVLSEEEKQFRLFEQHQN